MDIKQLIHHFSSLAFSFIIFVACFAFVAYQSSNCFEKYLKKDRSIDTSFVRQTEVEFPEMTLCPEYYTETPDEGPMAYNLSILEECGIRGEDMFYGKYYVSDKCSAGEILEKVHPKLMDFDIKFIEVLSGDGTKRYKFHGKSEDLIWKEWYLHGFGKCFTMKIPDSISKSNLGISFISLDAGIKHFRVYLHSSGLLGWPDFETGVAGIVLKARDSQLVSIEQEVIEYVDDTDQECNNEPGYDRDECVSEYVRKMSECVVPYGDYSGPLCENEHLVWTAFDALIEGLFLHTGCLIPCQFITHKISSRSSKNQKQEGNTAAVFWFKPLIKKSTSRIPYRGLELFGEVGGYVGLFLGLSVFHTRFIIEKILVRAFRRQDS